MGRISIQSLESKSKFLDGKCFWVGVNNLMDCQSLLTASRLITGLLELDPAPARPEPLFSSGDLNPHRRSSAAFQTIRSNSIIPTVRKSLMPANTSSNTVSVTADGWYIGCSSHTRKTEIQLLSTSCSLNAEIAQVSFREVKAMTIADSLSTRLAMSAGTDHMAARPAISDSLFQPPSFTATSSPGGSTVDDNSAPARNFRSVVERRFKRMNEAHDRIRTELLGADPPHDE